MTRKDYEKFAALFAGEMALANTSLAVNSSQRVATVRNIILSAADIFAQDNPRFDREKFYKASGL